MSKIKNFKIQTIEILKSKTIRSISTMLSANVGSAVIGFLITIISLRGLEENAIGILFPLISVTLMVKQFSDFGLNTAFIMYGSNKNSKNQDDKRSLYNNYFWLKIITASIVSIVGVSFSSKISLLIYQSSEHQLWVAIAFALAFFQITSMYFQATLQVQNSFKQLSLTKIVPQLLKLIGLSVLFYNSLLNLNNAFFFYMGIPALVLLMSVNKDNLKPLLNKVHLSQTREMLKVGKWVWLSMMANTAIAHLDVIMTRSMAGDSELAKLIAGQRLASVVPLITSSLVLVLLPKVSSTTTKEELQYFVRKVLTYMPILLIGVLLILPFTPFITNLLLGSKYYEASSVFNIYLFANSIGFILSPLGLVLYKLKFERVIAIIALIQFTFNIIGNYYLIPIYGANASASITLTCKLIAASLFIPILYKNGVIKRS